MNKIIWFKSALAAIIGGGLAGATASVQSGNISTEAIGSAAAVGAASVVIAYLMKSPKKE
jgi:hypothetical protein